MPSRGTELCAVVEAMFSYNTLFSVFGDVEFADRAERIAYNALPATWASPIGGDMWNHQYLQALNEINAASFPEHIWTTDGPDAELYGLEPNYGCCTANFNQGWPKFAHMVIFTSSDGGVAVGAFAPVSATLPNGAFVNITTEFPFGDVVAVVLQLPQNMPFYLRIPAWAVHANVSVNGGQAIPVPGNTMYKIALNRGTSTVVLNLNPNIRLEHWYSEETVTVHRGALMYSLPIAGNFTVLNTYPFDSHDYQVLPLTEWRYALVLDPDQPTSSFQYLNPGLGPDAAPFNHSNWASMIKATARVIPDWGLDKNSAAAPPASPACEAPITPCGDPVSVILVPYGGTDLRISELPWA